MQITQLTVARYADHQAVADLAAGREIVVVTVETDAGVVGTGFTNATVSRNGSSGEIVAAILRRYLAPAGVGQDPLLNELLWQRMYQAAAARMGRRGMVMGCLAAVDFALWDIKAKVLGAPLWELVGGYRERVPTYAYDGRQ